MKSFLIIGMGTFGHHLCRALCKLKCEVMIADQNGEALEDMFLRRCGADFIIYPERDAAERIAVRESSERIFDFIGLSQGCAICEIEVPGDWLGRSVAEVGLRSRHGLNLIAAKRGEQLHPVLDPAYVFAKDEHVLVLGSLDDIRKATRD